MVSITLNRISFFGLSLMIKNLESKINRAVVRKSWGNTDEGASKNKSTSWADVMKWSTETVATGYLKLPQLPDCVACEKYDTQPLFNSVIYSI